MASPVAPTRTIGAIARLMGFLKDCTDISEKTVAPVLDLLIRLWLAQTFWVSGLVKLGGWENAVFLATHEYPVTWLDPHTAAVIGVAIELIGPICLAFGLATRFAALAMLALTLVIQFEYLAIPVHEFWAILFAWYVARGAGPISLDRLLARGLADTALPFARALSALFGAAGRYLGPLAQLLVRVWMAKIFFLSGLTKARDFDNAILLFEYEYQTPLLSPELAASLAIAAELMSPVLIVAGLATRLAVVPLIVMTLVIQFTYLEHIDHLYWLALFGLILLYGPGPIALDYPIARWLRRIYPQLRGLAAFALEALPHVVIVGAGFGGLTAARALRKAACRVTVIDRHNYHLFQPLLYQCATASLRPSDIAVPVRMLFRDQPNARVLLGRVSGVDTDRREVAIGERRISYDYLVLATGARHGYFGRDDDWEALAPGLKKIEDAETARRRLLLAFEHAEASDERAVQDAYLTFVIVGGGPTGVELAGTIAELARHGMEREFRNIDPSLARIVLVQSGRRILPTFPERLSAIAQGSLEDLGVEVMTGCRFDHIDEEGVQVGDVRIAAHTVFWAAGVIASPAARWLGAEHDRAGRVIVAGDLSVPGSPDVYAIGDTALTKAWNGAPVPGLAPAAKQAGNYVARVIGARLAGTPPPAAFRYRHLGSLATIGRKAAVISYGPLALSGTLAWWLWGLAHIYFQVGTRNRISVALEWMWAYLTFRRGTRLITGGPAA